MLALHWQNIHGSFIALLIFNHYKLNYSFCIEPNKNLWASQVKTELKGVINKLEFHHWLL